MDIYIPDKKIIIEIQGPNHYMKPEYKNLHMNSKFKLKLLERLGYNVIEIPFLSVEMNK